MGVLSRLGLVLAVLVTTAHAPAAPESPPGQYRGHVVEAGSGRPIAAAGVFLVWPSRDDATIPPAYREARTDAHGQFSIDATTIEHTRLRPPQLWVYKAGYQLYPDRDVRPAGAAAAVLAQPAATIRLIGARTNAERVESLNDFVAVVNRYAPTAGPILLDLIEGELTRLRSMRPDPVTVTPTPPSHPGAPGPCDADPRNPPPLPPPKPPRTPEPGTYNPYEGRRAPYYGKVVDAESGTPLRGAVVVAVWTKRVVMPFHAYSVTHEACDVLSDADGRFVLDGRRIEQAGVPGLEPPTFSVFIPGFSAWGVQRHRVPSRLSTIRGDSQGFHDVTIALTRLQRREDRLDVVSGVPAPASDIPLEKVPRLLDAWGQERANLRLH